MCVLNHCCSSFPFSHVSLCVIVTLNINAVVILPFRLTSGDLSIEVNLNDYLDIYCPYYPSEETLDSGLPETMALYLVGEASFQGCVETRGSIKRWECNTPHAPFGPVRFSEKIQRFTPFSLGFEFLPGRHYYYSCEYLCFYLLPVLQYTMVGIKQNTKDALQNCV